MSDEGFHEIQLNGKRLVFLCMTASLILVVAFLSGVLVGRGVRSERDSTIATAEAAAAAASPAGVADPAQAVQGGQGQAAPPITAIAPPTPVEEDLSYNSRLQGNQAPSETVPPAGGRAAEALPAADQARNAQLAKADAKARPAAEQPGAGAPKAGAGEPAGSGYYLKVVAYRDRGQADTLVKRLAGKGYGAYVVPLSERSPVLYSVRVGKYKTRREADTIKRRLEKEEQLKPLVLH